MSSCPRRARPALLAALILVLALVLPAAAQGGYWTLLLDDQPVPAELPPIQVAPEVLLVSGRSLAHRMGAELTFDAASGAIKISTASVRIDMKENDTGANVNGRRFVMPVAPRRENGTLMVPVPFIPQSLGAKVTWNQNARMALITSAPGAAPAASAPIPLPQAVPAAATPPPAPTASKAYEVDPQVQTQQPATVGGPPLVSGGPIASKSGIGANGMPIGMMGGPFTMTPVMPSAQPPTQNPGEQNPPTPNDATWTTAPTVAGPGDMVVRTIAMAGSMDAPESLQPQAPASGDIARPDPAITGLLIERRFDSLFTSYSVRYRITNLGTVALQRQALIRLLVGSDKANGMQIVQDIKIERLDPGQSLDFEWTGNSRSYPVLYEVAVKAEARLMLTEGSYDAREGNNRRSARLSH